MKTYQFLLVLLTTVSTMICPQISAQQLTKFHGGSQLQICNDCHKVTDPKFKQFGNGNTYVEVDSFWYKQHNPLILRRIELEGGTILGGSLYPDFNSNFAPDDPRWTQLGPEGGEAMSLLMSPDDNNTLYSLAYGYPTQVYRTTNAGTSWERISAINQYLYALAIDPQQAQTLYTAGVGHNLHKSYDGGISWENHQIGTELPIINKICVSGINTDVIYAVGYYQDSRSIFAVYKSVDAGTTWTKFDIAPASYVDGYGLSIAVHPINPDTVYTGGYLYDGLGRIGMLYKSTNGGGDWIDIYTNISGYIYDIVIDPTLPQNVFVGTPFGIYRTSDGGVTWVQNEGYALAYQLAIDQFNTNIIYGGAYETVYKSTDGGVYWNGSGAGLAGFCNALALDHVDADNIYYGGSAGVYRSNDAGQNWSVINSGFFASSIDPLVIALSAPNVIYAEFLGVAIFRSTDFGLNWERLAPFPVCGNIVALAVDPQFPDTAYALAGPG